MEQNKKAHQRQDIEKHQGECGTILYDNLCQFGTTESLNPTKGEK